MGVYDESWPQREGKMRITPGDAAEREPRPVAGARIEATRTPGPRAAQVAAELEPASLLPRSIARSQMVVAGLRQMQAALARPETIDVGALVSAVRFEGEQVLLPRRDELQEIARTRDTARLARLVDTMESNARALLDKIIAALGSRGSQPSTLRPDRVIELLKPSP
jgi:hypothetical protein